MRFKNLLQIYDELMIQKKKKKNVINFSHTFTIYTPFSYKCKFCKLSILGRCRGGNIYTRGYIYI